MLFKRPTYLGYFYNRIDLKAILKIASTGHTAGNLWPCLHYLYSFKFAQLAIVSVFWQQVAQVDKGRVELTQPDTFPIVGLAPLLTLLLRGQLLRPRTSLLAADNFTSFAV